MDPTVPTATRADVPPVNIDTGPYWKFMRHGSRRYVTPLQILGRAAQLAVDHGIGVEAFVGHVANPRNAACYAAYTDRDRHGRRSVRASKPRELYEKTEYQRKPTGGNAPSPEQIAEWAEYAMQARWRAKVSYDRMEKGEKGEIRTVTERVTGTAVQTVYLAHLRLATSPQARRGVYPASSRMLAELAGVQHKTAQRATRALIALGLVRMLDPTEAKQHSALFSANRYSLKKAPETVLRETWTNVPRREGMVTPLGYVSPPAWTRQHPAFRSQVGVAFDSWSVIVAMGGDATVSQVAKVLGKSPSTIRYQVAKQERFGLVHRDDDGRLSATFDLAELDRVAVECGAVERVERQRALHAADRLVRADNIAKGKARRDPTKALTHLGIVDRDTGEVVPYPSQQWGCVGVAEGTPTRRGSGGGYEPPGTGRLSGPVETVANDADLAVGA